MVKMKTHTHTHMANKHGQSVMYAMHTQCVTHPKTQWKHLFAEKVWQETKLNSSNRPGQDQPFPASNQNSNCWDHFGWSETIGRRLVAATDEQKTKTKDPQQLDEKIKNENDRNRQKERTEEQRTVNQGQTIKVKACGRKVKAEKRFNDDQTQ